MAVEFFLKRNPKLKIQDIKVVILRLSSIGDVVLATSTLQFLLKLLKAHQVLWVGEEPSLSLIKEFYPKVTYYRFSDPNFSFSQLKNVTFVFDLQGNLKSRLLCFFLQVTSSCTKFSIKKEYFYRWKLIFIARLFGRKFPFKPNFMTPRVLQYESMLNCLNSAFCCSTHFISSIKPKLESKHKKLNYLLPGEKYYLAIAPGASHENKKAPISVILEIIHLFYDLIILANNSFKEKVVLVFLGDFNDSRGINTLTSCLSEEINYLDFSSKLDLCESAYILKKSQVLLTNDSGLLHISEAINTPVAAIFGPTVEGFGFRPFLEKSRVFSSDISCRPCSRHGKGTCRYNDRACFYSLSSKEIAQFLVSFFVDK